jgi:uncharacterized phage protein gp47/JayE
MVGFGVTEEGFTIKGLDVILSENLDRAFQMFGAGVDLSATSPLRKILEVTAAEDAELWKRMENVYYSNFVSTAVGDSLDLLGEDLGRPRQQLFAQGEVTFLLNNPLPGRQYTLLEGTVVITAAPVIAFYTTAPLTLSANAPQATVTVQAFERGPAGNIAAKQIVGIDPVYQQIYINLGGSTTVQVTNAQAFGTPPFTSGTDTESDQDYQARLLGLPHNIWTLESVRSAALDVTGVLDVLLSDPLGGADVSQSYFNLFKFDERLFSGERRLGEPYFFDVVVAHEFAWPWRTQGPVPGIYDRVLAAIDGVRPIGIHPNIIQADHIEVGVRATVIVDPGRDPQTLLAAIKQQLATDIGLLKLGGNVLFSQVMRAFVEQPGVIDVQNMHLRRCPAAFGRITFGAVPFQSDVLEATVGENLLMGPIEIAIFRIDSALIDLKVVPQ